MKEIWIEKLVELLNEYDGDVLEYWFVDGDIRRKVKNFDNERNTWKSVVWYTKQFWFIKWLVENDKIDRDKKEIEKSDYDITFTWALTKDKKSDLDIMVDTLLMLLSISDTPIEDLISYLK